ncbi:MAG: hypothetical protein LUE27_05435 [Clostridia bacterium]|nr:hypothetical protein [Clostridia bacterium]
MAETTKNYRMRQKVSEDDHVVLHPETDAEIVLAEIEGIDAGNVKGVLEELAARVAEAAKAGVSGLKGSAESEYRTGEVEISAEDIGLGNVDDTADTDKPVSTAVQAALDEVTKAIPDVSGFAESSDLENYYTKDETDKTVSGLEDKISETKAKLVAGVSLTMDDGYVITFSIETADGNVYTSKPVDLPLETMVVDGSYDAADKCIDLKLNNENVIHIPVGDIIDGLASSTELENEATERKAADDALTAAVSAVSLTAESASEAAKTAQTAADTAQETADAALSAAQSVTSVETAEKLASARTIQVNLASASAASFDGSANITPGVTGILPVANGGTGNSTGLAASATILATARTIQTNLASTSAASFNGSANVTPGVTGILPAANGGTGASSLADVTVGTASEAAHAASADTATTATTATSATSATTATTATKLGSSTVGSGTQPVYLSSGTATASTSTVGSATKLMYLSSGVLTASSSTVGSGVKPIYLSSGTITASTSTVGSATNPVYLNAGTLTAANTIPAITLNGSATTSPSIYAPTTYGTSGYLLAANGSGSAPVWQNGLTNSLTLTNASGGSFTYNGSSAVTFSEVAGGSYIGYCTTESSSATKTVALVNSTGFSLRNGVQISVYFNYTSYYSASYILYLNVNSTGAVAVYVRSGSNSRLGTNGTIRWSNETWVTFIYANGYWYIVPKGLNAFTYSTYSSLSSTSSTGAYATYTASYTGYVVATFTSTKDASANAYIRNSTINTNFKAYHKSDDGYWGADGANLWLPVRAGDSFYCYVQAGTLENITNFAYET